MTIHQGSRYENSPVISIKKPEGNWTPTVFRTNPPVFPVRGEIHANGYENLQQLAQRLYADPELWWVLADANPQVFYPDVIPEGTVLQVP